MLEDNLGPRDYESFERDIEEIFNKWMDLNANYMRQDILDDESSMFDLVANSSILRLREYLLPGRFRRSFADEDEVEGFKLLRDKVNDYFGLIERSEEARKEEFFPIAGPEESGQRLRVDYSKSAEETWTYRHAQKVLEKYS